MRACYAAILGCLWLASPSLGWGGECADLNPTSVPNAGTAKRPVVAEDLIGLRDIGASWLTEPASKVFNVSPDGKWIAFHLRRANLRENTYCLGVYVIPALPGATPIEVNLGGEDIRTNRRGAGFAQSVPPGNAQNLIPAWAPNGKRLAFLRRDHGVTQLWLGNADGSGTAALTTETTDVEAFAWSDDGATLIYSTRPGLKAEQEKIDAEGANGFLFDDRYIPVASNRPFIREPVSVEVRVVEVATGRQRAASALERDKLLQPNENPSVSGAELTAVSPTGWKAWASSTDTTDVTALLRLHAEMPGHKALACQDSACVGVSDLMWTADSRTVLFLRYEGWRRSQTGVYAWAPGEAVHRLLMTDDLLIGCSVVPDGLVCAHEGALQPREIVHISLSTGQMTRLFDPNPQVRQLELGQSERLKWRNRYGIEAYGDFVLPPSHKPGQKHPMVVVQYQSRGFLRGGTGDEFPIQVLAAHGFAVLSIERPPTVGMARKPKSWEEVNRLDRVDWADFRSLQSNLEVGVKAAVATGTVDASRVGLTGLSNGASTAQFTIINSQVFSALALATCCEEPPVTNTLDGPVFVKAMAAIGYPGLLQDGAAFWQDMSIRQNVASLDLPILMQLPDDEYLGSLESYMSLKAAGKPAELYVFPDEFHIKIQPVHRLAAYTRSVDWFDYWLQNRIDPDPAKDIQYQRWAILKAHRPLRPGATPGP